MIGDEQIKKRLAALRAKMQDQAFDTLMILCEENRRFLSGFTGKDGQFDETAGVLLIAESRQLIATDSRYDTQAKAEAPLFSIRRYDKGFAAMLPDLLRELGTRALGFESVRLSYLNFRKVQEAVGSVALIPVEDLVEELRIIKEEAELDAIKASLALSESVLESVLLELAPGVAEKRLAWAIEKGLREGGAESVAFPPIVAFGDNAAMPHAIPGKRPVAEGEPILFDWGARLNGYCSDISRTVVLGRPDDTFKTVYQVVRDAQRMAIDAIRPGANTKAVDAVAREYISQKGFGDYFGHGLGHGVGLAVHEAPRLSPLRSTDLRLGMVTTVEPGIYIPGWGGVRLENMVVVREDGAEVLNREHPPVAMMDHLDAGY